MNYQMSYAVADLRRMVENVARLAEQDDRTYQDGYQAGRTAAASAQVLDVPTTLRKIAGWVDAQQLPADGEHAAEAQTRRRLVVLLRDMAERDLSFTAVYHSLRDEA